MQSTLAPSIWTARLAAGVGNVPPVALLIVAPGKGLAVYPACVLVLTFAAVSEHVSVRAPQLFRWSVFDPFRTIAFPKSGRSSAALHDAWEQQAALASSTLLGPLVLQKLVDESDRHAALPDRGCNTFDRAQPHIPAREYTGGTRFEQVGIAIVRPAPGFHHIVTGQNVPAGVARNLHREPAGFRVGPNEDK